LAEVIIHVKEEMVPIRKDSWLGPRQEPGIKETASCTGCEFTLSTVFPISVQKFEVRRVSIDRGYAFEKAVNEHENDHLRRGDVVAIKRTRL